VTALCRASRLVRNAGAGTVAIGTQGGGKAGSARSLAPVAREARKAPFRRRSVGGERAVPEVESKAGSRPRVRDGSGNAVTPFDQESYDMDVFRRTGARCVALALAWRRLRRRAAA
jgi:hypothetical protein